MLVNKTTRARKKRGRLQIWRVRPVRSKMATKNQAARNPASDTIKIQGTYKPRTLNSGRFPTPKALNNLGTGWKLPETVASTTARSAKG
jgi:hypothetical protein